MWVNILTIVIGVVSIVPTSFQLSSHELEVILFVNAGLNIVLRVIAGGIKNPMTGK